LYTVTNGKKGSAGSDASFSASLIGFDPKLIPSVVSSLQSFRSASSFTVLDPDTVKKAAEAFGSFKLVAPEISEALNKVPITPSAPFKAVAGEIPVFTFASALKDVDLSAFAGLNFAESFKGLDLAPFTKGFYSIELPASVTADLASQFDRITHDAVALAEVDVVAESVEDIVGVQLEALTPAKKRALALDVVILIAAFLLFAAWATQDGSHDPKAGAGTFLTVAAMYIRVYWQLIGRLEED
jgi:hypothetical protein